MKILKKIGKFVKYILWIILIVLLSLFVIGYLQYSGGVGDYLRFLNQKDWGETVQTVKIWNPGTWTELFWSSEQWTINNEQLADTWDVVNDVEEFEISGLDMSGVDEIDVFDPAFEEEFESFFETEELTKEIGEGDEVKGASDEDGEGFGFVMQEVGVQIWSEGTGMTEEDEKMLKLIKNRQMSDE